MTFVWPFIFAYSIEKTMTFLLNGSLNLRTWSEINKMLRLLALAGIALATLGLYLRYEWLMDIGIIILAIGISGIKFLVGTNKNLPSITTLVSGIATIFCLIVMTFLLLKVSAIYGFLFFGMLIFLETIYAWMIEKDPKTSFNKNIVINKRQYFIDFIILITFFIVSIFKKTGQISDFSIILVILAIIGITIEKSTLLKKPDRPIRIWLGGIKNYIIVYTLLFAFQQDKAIWIFIMFTELLLSGMLAKIIIKKTHNIKLTQKFTITFFFLLLGLLITCNEFGYLFGIGLVLLCDSLLNIWSKGVAHDDTSNISAKLSSLGSLLNQIILFGTLEIISYIKLDNKLALLMPYLSHQSELVYTPEMTYLRLLMLIIFIITGLGAYCYIQKDLFKNN